MPDTIDTGAQADADDQTGDLAPDDTTTIAEPDSDDDGSQSESPNAEAAKYRTRLRETEAQRDQLAERLAVYQRREAEAAIAEVLDQPADLWAIGGADATAFYDSDGALQTADLLAAAAALADERPRLAAQPEPAQPKQWGQVSAGHAPPGNGLSWSDIITPR